MKYIKTYESYSQDVLDINPDEVIKWGDDNNWSVPFIDNEASTDEEYYDILRDEIISMIKFFNTKINTQVIPIYRVVSLDDPNDLDTNNLGKSWSYNKDGYKYYMDTLDGYKKGKMYMITSDVEIDNIDWNMTIFQNIMSSGEQEIVVKDDSLLTVVSLDKINEKR